MHNQLVSRWLQRGVDRWRRLETDWQGVTVATIVLTATFALELV
ncbi:hypothetical protein ACLI4U_06865 [Natrialbaceae archaeon A-CW2]|nr:hypothetical protein [Natronosalvus amylolyticus]